MPAFFGLYLYYKRKIGSSGDNVPSRVEISSILLRLPPPTRSGRPCPFTLAPPRFKDLDDLPFVPVPFAF